IYNKITSLSRLVSLVKKTKEILNPLAKKSRLLESAFFLINKFSLGRYHFIVFFTFPKSMHSNAFYETVRKFLQILVIFCCNHAHSYRDTISLFQLDVFQSGFV